MSLDDLFKQGSSISALMQNGLSQQLEIDLDLIDFDPDQPRKAFDAAALDALAKSITEHGLLQAISLRSNPDKPGYYIVNYGERRTRAARTAGLKKIPAVINESFSKIAQAVENILREELSLIDRLKLFKEFSDAGMKQKDIIKQIGHPDPAWVSRHMTVLSAPELVLEAVMDGRIKSLEVAQTLTSKFNAGDEHGVRIFLESIELGESATTHLMRQYFKKQRVAAVSANDEHGADSGSDSAGTGAGSGGKGKGQGKAKDDEGSNAKPAGQKDKIVKSLKKMDAESVGQIQAIVQTETFELIRSLPPEALKSVLEIAQFGDEIDIQAILDELNRKNPLRP